MGLSQITSWINYRKNSVTKYRVHSPFVYELATGVFPPQPGETFSNHPAEQWRSECLADHAVVHVEDFGTGKTGTRRISAIAARSAKTPKEGQLLHRIVKHFQPKKMLELGTSLGITTLYQATAIDFDRYISIEGAGAIAEKALGRFAKLNLPVEVRVGTFESQLEPALRELGQVDYIFFDGNHREKPTLRYFETILPYAHADSVFIFDDIHWSPEMESAWKKIKAHPQVKLSIDLFHFGLIFFRKEQQEKEDFILRW
ncbi:MAG TPA: class I SAM-dependent methyltransferase [Bacteroidia bacterium]|nr:class I SAM-dependent methyltransferase [Bacteroidia bacterium]